MPATLSEGTPATQPPQPRRLPPLTETIISELRQQWRIAAPLALMNLTCFAKTIITTVFLGRLGGLHLAGGALGFTVANVTGFSVLSGLSAAMEPICGQAHGAGNRQLLRLTLLMAVLLLLAASLPIALIWFNADKILLCFGQQPEIAGIAKKFVVFLIPELPVTSFLNPLRAYLSSQGVILPSLFSSAMALALHLPLNLLLSKNRGLEGIAMAVWITDLTVAAMQALYVYIKEEEISGICSYWKKSSPEIWKRVVRLAVPCCLTTCLEWWCFEILVLLTGKLPDADRMLAVIAVVFNFDYLLFSVMLSLAIGASVRVANELGSGHGHSARASAGVSLGMGALGGVLGAAATAAAATGGWGELFSGDSRVLKGVRKTMMVMAAVEIVNFPLAVSGGIARGTGRPWFGTCASAGGFYLVALPAAAALGFKMRLGLDGMLLGFLAGGSAGVVLLLAFLAKIDWTREAENAQTLAGISLDGGDQSDCFEIVNNHKPVDV
ncbi:MATE efflux family protein DTX1 [Apostasia shenzhenica]|uniref:Protein DETOXIFICATION n=1 Tax=Apostasia shenzhenica TaxID=1088818 RepID=A0A2I0AC13_9ASPA|nr:MATE efflux family protein DTX1 [Apostasia shenzhenica]